MSEHLIFAKIELLLALRVKNFTFYIYFLEISKLFMFEFIKEILFILVKKRTKNLILCWFC